MHYKKVKGILSNGNGMNLYRGCTHGCIYCDSRSNCYQINHKFEDIEVKENALELLEMELIKKRKKCMIGTGAMTDPYCHIESVAQLTKKSLELIYKYGFGITLITKSTRLLADLQLLKKINEKSKVIIQVTLTTYNDELSKKLEPNVSTTRERIEMLKILRDNGIETIVWLCPILPFINDNEQNILSIVEECKNAKVYGIICFGIGMTLREGNREYFYKKLDQLFPGLKEKYINTYGNNYIIDSKKNYELMKLLKKKCDEYNIILDKNYLFSHLKTFEEKEIQLSLF